VKEESMNRLLFVVVLTGLLLTVNPCSVHACQCGPPPSPLDDYNQVEAVFTGVVISIEQDETYTEFNSVEIQITSFWKGVSTATVYVLTGWFEGSCGYTFTIGEEYIIYADDDFLTESGPLVTDVCHRTRLVADAQEDYDVLGDPDTVPVDSESWGVIKSIHKE
jgi:hypothetical protein